MKLLLVDTRPFVTTRSITDFHLEEMIRAWTSTEQAAEVSFLSPSGQLHSLSKQQLEVQQEPSAWRSMAFVQRGLVQVAKNHGMQAILTMFGGAPLRASVPVFCYLPWSHFGPGISLSARLAEAAGKAGAGGATAHVGYTDLPGGGSDRPVIKLQPWVDPIFNHAPAPGDKKYLKSVSLQPGFVLGFGWSLKSIPLRMAAWSWVASSTGDAVPLVLIGMTPDEVALARQLAHQSGSLDTLKIIETPGLESLAALYRSAGVFMDSGHQAHAQSLRWAIATQTPVASIESTASDRLLGDAAYLTPPGDSRALGAAILSMIVEESLAEEMRNRAGVRGKDYFRPDPLEGLVSGLNDFLG